MPTEGSHTPKQICFAPWLRKKTSAALIVGVAAVVICLAAWRGRSQYSSPVASTTVREAIERVSIARPRVSNPGYVGSQACAECHRERVAEFKLTNHFRACYPPHPDEMPPAFTEAGSTFKTDVPGLSFRMTRRGDRFYQTAIRRTQQGETEFTSEIALVYGIGNADSVYFAWHENRLHELPIAWLFTSDQWGAAGFDPYGADDYSRATTPRCMECHNTWFEHIPGTLNEYDPSSFIFGVTCERCHGPGRDHVAVHQSHPQARSAQNILHPGTLDRELQIAVCTQCHSNAIKYRGPAMSYRPGQPLESSYKFIVSEHSEEDHVANQIQYLRASKCFQKSSTLTCITCHDPHRHTEPADAGVRSCLTCHQRTDCGEQHHLPTALQNECVSCHMPAQIKININFETEEDRYVPPIRRFQHRIGIYPEARDAVLLAWHRKQPGAQSIAEAERLTQKLAEHWLAEAEKRRREHRFLGAIAALREAHQINPSPEIQRRLQSAVEFNAGIDDGMATANHLSETRQFDEAIQLLEDILQLNPRHAKAHSKLGTLYAVKGDMKSAVQHLEKVAECDPNDSSGHSMLGWLAYLAGRTDEAVRHYQRADEIDPFHAKINYHWSLALMKDGRWPDAEKQLRRVLEIDPIHAGGTQALAHTLVQQGRSDEALPVALRAARLTDSRNPDVLLTLAGIYEANGQFDKAVQAATLARTAARRTSPAMIPEIDITLARLRARAEAAGN